MSRTFKKRTCPAHGDWQPTGPAGRCPKCKASKKPGAKARPCQASTPAKPGRVKKGNGHAAEECEGCKALQLQIDDITRTEKIMVAAGLVPAEKFEQARKIVRDLHKEA